MLELDPGMMIWTWITFFIVITILYKVALKPMLAAIQNREKAIHDDLQKAASQREDAEKLLAEHKKMMADAETEAQKILKLNQELAEKSKQEILESARANSAQLIEKAKKEIDQQKESAIASLKAEVADMAIGAAEKILVQSLDKEKQKKLVDDYIESMPKSSKN